MKEFRYEHIQFKDSDYPFVFHRGCTVNQTHNFPAHWHESVEILYFYDGKCDVTIDTKTFSMHPCDILCINSEKVHYISTDTYAKYNTLIISPSFIKKMRNRSTGAIDAICKKRGYQLFIPRSPR